MEIDEALFNCDCRSNGDGTVTLSLDIHNVQWNKLVAIRDQEEEKDEPKEE